MTDRNLRPDSGNDLVLEDAGSTDRMRITDGGSTILYEDGGAAALTIDTDGDVNLTQDIYLASGKGIYFDGGTTSANYLGGTDAYEEGTWTATTTSGAIESSSAVCTYTKIGNLVTLMGQVQVSSPGTASVMIINNCPFVCAANLTNNANKAAGSINPIIVDIPGSPGVNCLISASSNDLKFQYLIDEGYPTGLPMTASSFFGFTITYST